MRNRRKQGPLATVALGLLFTIAAGPACTSHSSQAESPLIERLQANLTREEGELVKLEEQIKDPTTEIGKKASLTSDRELMLSRIARIRENLDDLKKPPVKPLP